MSNLIRPAAVYSLFGSARRRLTSLPVAIAFTVALIALVPMPAQASTGTIAPQSGNSPTAYETGGYNGRVHRPTYRKPSRKRSALRYQQHNSYQDHRHAQKGKCCVRYDKSPAKHPDRHFDKDGHKHGKGTHGHNAYDNKKGDKDKGDHNKHKGHGYNARGKYGGSKYGDGYDPYYRDGEDEDDNSSEAYSDDVIEEKGGVASTESTETMSDVATTEDATTEDAATDEATTDDGSAVASAAPADSGVGIESGGIVQLSTNEALGNYLVDANGMTLYRYDLDTAEASACTDGCAENWMPLTVPADTELVAGEGVPGSLGAIVREDGSTQVTYNGAPLYYFIDDQQPGDTSGQGAGDAWWVVNP